MQHQNEASDHHLQLITVFTASMDLKSMEIRREIQVIHAIKELFISSPEQNGQISYRYPSLSVVRKLSFKRLIKNH